MNNFFLTKNCNPGFIKFNEIVRLFEQLLGVLYIEGSQGADIVLVDDRRGPLG